MDLQDARAEIADALRDTLALVAAGSPVSAISAELEEACGLFQALGLCALLTDLDAEGFRTNLLRSVQARRFFLRRARLEGLVDDRRLAPSRTESLFDALVAGHEAELQSLCALSETGFDPRWEYEDDHVAQTWMRAMALGVPDAELAALQERHRHALAGASDTRFRVLAALTRRHAQAFDEALHVLMREVDEAQQLRLEGKLEPDLEACMLWPRSFVSVEGLALLALARRRGVDAPGPYRLCPQVARLPPSDADTEDFFAGIERILDTEGR